MKIVELISRIQLPITNEEAELLDRFVEGSTILKTELDERQQVVANQLVNKNVLIRRIQDGQVLFKKKISQ